MPVCIKCSKDNPTATKYCENCGAVLPQMAPIGNPATSFDVDEDTEYITPNFHYPADEMLNLAWTANDFLEEGAELEPFLEAYEVVKNKFGPNMYEQLATLRELIANDRARDPEEAFPKQVNYLYNKGAGLAEAGLALIEAFLTGLEEENLVAQKLRDGVVKLVMANDHFCLAIALTNMRIEGINKALDQAGLKLNDNFEVVIKPNLQPPPPKPAGVASEATNALASEEEA